MRIAYVTHTRFPTEKAHGHQVAHVCTALAALGHAVAVIAPDLPTGTRQTAHVYYGLPKEVHVKKLPVFDALNHPLVPGALAFLCSMYSYRKALRAFLKRGICDVLYARSPSVVPVLLAAGIPVVLELHTLPKRGMRRFVSLCNRCALIVCLTSPMRDELIAAGGDPKRMIVEGDAVDTARFDTAVSAAKAKKDFALPSDRPVIGYAGSFVTFDNLQKGVDVLIAALARLKKQDIPVRGFIVGGPKQWMERYRKSAYALGLTDDDIVFHDAVRSADVPRVLAACDVLVYPAPASPHPFFRRDTSPLKLFEYLASGVPVVCADLPPVRDIVDASSVRFAQPGSETSFAGSIRDVLENKKDAAKRVKNGLAVIREHTWEKRMERILKRL